MHNLNDSSFKLLCESGTLETFSKNHIFYDSHHPQDYVYCLIEGICALTSLKECGKEHIYYYLKPGAVLCFIPALFKSVNHCDLISDPYFMLTAKSTCKAYKLSRAKCFELMNTHPPLIEFIMCSLTNTSRSIVKHFYAAQESNAVSKIAFTLLALSEDCADCCETILQKEFNYTELAKYLGVHHITVARIMTLFKEKGIIKKRGRQIIIKNKEELMLYSKNYKTLHY